MALVRPILRMVVVAGGIFLPAAVVWLIVLGSMTEGYECGRADVECEPWKEELSYYGPLGGLAVIAIASLALGWLSVRERLRRVAPGGDEPPPQE